MNLVSVGINHKTAPIEIREKVALTDSSARLCLERLKSDAMVREAVVLSTCNRVEIYGLLQEGKSSEDLIRFLADFHQVTGSNTCDKFYSFHQHDVVRHLFCVCTGIDSMVIGENEILGQVKKYYQLAHEMCSTGPILNNLFQRSFSVSKYLRTETALGRGNVSISSIAIELAEKIFGSLVDRDVLLIGAGKVSHLTGKYLVSKGVRRIVTSSRSYEKAQLLAKSLDGIVICFDDLHQAMKEVDIVISSTSAPVFIISKDGIVGLMKERHHRPLFIIDLAVPRDVDSTVNDVDNVYLYNIDDLKEISQRNRASREKEIERSYDYIEKETIRFMQWINTLDVVPTIKALTNKMEMIRQKELQDSFAELKSSDPQQYSKIDYATKKMLNSIFHQPITELKEKKKSDWFYYQIESIRELFGLKEDSSDEK